MPSARTMLVVGTDVRLRADLERIGRELGLVVSFVEDLRQALLAIETTRFDVVIVRAGDHLHGQILQIEALDERPAVLAVVASEDPEAIAASFRAGAEDVLSMPLNTHELSAAIERTFGPVPVEPGLASRDRLN